MQLARERRTGANLVNNDGTLSRNAAEVFFAALLAADALALHLLPFLS